VKKSKATYVILLGANLGGKPTFSVQGAPKRSLENNYKGDSFSLILEMNGGSARFVHLNKGIP